MHTFAPISTHIHHTMAQEHTTPKKAMNAFLTFDTPKAKKQKVGPFEIHFKVDPNSTMVILTDLNMLDEWSCKMLYKRYSFTSRKPNNIEWAAGVTSLR